MGRFWRGSKYPRQVRGFRTKRAKKEEMTTSTEGISLQQANVITWRDPHVLKAHPLNVKIYGDDGYGELVESIKELGVLQALYARKDGTIISGHRRWRAAIEAGCVNVPVIEVSYATDLDERQAIIEHNRYRVKTGLQFLNEGTELEAIQSEKARRRQATSTGGSSPQLTESFREAASLQTDDRRERETSAVVAKAIGLGSGKQWDKLKYVGEHKPDLLPDIKPGGISIDRAFRETRVEVVKATTPEPPPLPTDLYNVIYADPPWKYDNAIQDWGPASLHYKTLDINELCALHVPATENAVLFLWATNPFLKEAITVAEAWGFEYKTNMVWVKTELQRPGSGFYVRGRHELLLICTKGSFVPNQNGKAPIGSVVEAPAREHSRKPDYFYGIIENMYPAAKYLELFLRGTTHPNWDGWGNEVGE